MARTAQSLIATERLWTPDELAERYGLSPLTLRTWRYQHRGPQPIYVGGKPRYRDSDVARWEAARDRERP